MGLYDQQPISMATNSAAQRYYSRYGQMPNRTVGGLYGGALPNPDNVPTPQQTLGYATGNQYAPMRQPGLGMAPTTQAGYQQQMAQQNPGGGLFGGALPAYGMSSGGQTRPMWMGAPAQAPAAGNYSLPQSRFIGGQRAYTDGSNLTQISQGDPQYKRMQDAQAMFDARRGGLAQRQQDYQQRTQTDMQARGLGVAQNAYNKSQARKSRLGIGDPLDMAMRQNSEIAGMMGMGQLGLQGQQMQYGLMGQAMANQQQQQHLQNLSGLAGSIAQMDIPPGLKQQYMNQIMSAHGLNVGGQQGNGAGGLTGNGQQRANYSLTPKQQGEYRALKTPQEREAWLNQNGIMDPTTRQYMLGAGGLGMGVQSPPAPGIGDYAGAGALGGMAGLGGPLMGLLPYWMQPTPSKPTRRSEVGPDGKRRTVPIPPKQRGLMPSAGANEGIPMY